MQCRRRDDHVRESQSMRLHAQDQLHLDPGRYCNLRREAFDRSPRLRRSLSPHRNDGSRREMGFGQRIDNSERREYDWHLKSGRDNGVWLRSPSYGQVRKRPHLEEAFLHKDHRQLSELQQVRGLHEPRNVPAGDEVLDYKHDLRYKHDALRSRKESEIVEGRWSDESGLRMTDRTPLPLARKEGTTIGSYRSCLDMGPMSIYEDSGFLPSSRRSDVRSIDNERLKFQNPLVADKREVEDSHKVEERRGFNSRDDAYSMSSGFYSREYASSSSGSLTRKCLDSYRDGHYFQVSDEFSRSRGDVMDPVQFDSYGERTLANAAIDPEAGKRNLAHHQRGANSLRREHEDYFYSKSDGMVNDSHRYPSGERQRINRGHDFIDYDSAVGSDHGDILIPKLANTDLMKLQNAEDLSADHKTELAYNPYSFQKHTVPDYRDMGPSTDAIKHDLEYARKGSLHVEVGKRISRDYEVSQTNPSQYCQVLRERSDYESQSEVGPRFLKERLRRCSMVGYDEETYRNTEEVQRITEGVGTYKLRSQTPKRKYYEEDTNLLNHRINMPCEYMPSEITDFYDGDEDLIDDDISGQYTSREAGFDHNKFRRSNKKYNRRSLYISDDLFSRASYFDNGRKYKSGPRRIKDDRRHCPSSWIKSKKFDSRNSLCRQHKVFRKNDEDNDCVHVSDDYLSDDSVTPTESEPSLDSEEFKQMVHEAFLKYTKKLNMKPGVRKRYKKQGNAGSLYCIVCGISVSKEYMDTERLVRHAYTSHKVGLRAKHLGLVKAICVLMGWNNEILRDPTIWVPEVLPEAEALAQKQDLIIWSPLIVIRNISLAYNNRDKWRVVTIEELESFLRSKGLLKGRVKMSLGRPADKSVIVLKFLPTFSGLTDAERLHMFFSERRHGRVDFELAKCNKDKSSSNNREGVGTEGDEMVERILYGYMGIAEDLDELDFNMKKVSLIKSKKEILEL